MNAPTLLFPGNFVWGAATSAYQIEGAVALDGRAPSIWDTFTRQPGHIAQGHHGDTACDSYHRVDEDVQLLARLGVKAYRFSISWPRVLPRGRGELNPLGVAYYRRLINALRAAGIEPIVTLYHWDLPQCLFDEGGWLRRDTAHAFAAYAGAMFDTFADVVPVWFTINEPWCASFLSHAMGQHAPGERNLGRALHVAHHLLLAHGLAVREFRKRGASGRIGMAPNVEWLEPYSEQPEDVAACERGLDWFNRWFMDPLYHARYPADMLRRYAQLGLKPPVESDDMAVINEPTDLLGINYYTGGYGRARTSPVPLRADDSAAAQIDALRDVDTVDVPGFRHNHLGWNIFPEAFYKFLVSVRNEYGNPPVFITENGACDNTPISADGKVHDVLRIEYHHRHVIALHRAIRSGCNIQGYMAWSLLDNFEWAHGYTQRFGLVHVDFDTQKRTPKDSFDWYHELIQNNGCGA